MHRSQRDFSGHGKLKIFQHPTRSFANRCVLLLALCSLSIQLDAASATVSDDSLEPLLARGIQYQLQGNHDQSMRVAYLLKERFPDSVISGALEMNSLVSRLSWDPEDTQFDEALEAEANAALTLCEQHTQAHPDDAEGYLLCGQAHFALTFLYAARGSYYRAGRNSSHTITQLEAALELDPTLVDAKIYLGATYYYADNLPPFVKAVSRFLWFIPSGNSAQALPYMKAAAQDGQYLQGVAKFIYANLVMSSEPELIGEAGSYLEDLVVRYPTNRRFQLKYMQYLAQIGQFDEVLEAAESFISSQSCCRIAAVDAELTQLWKVRAYLELSDTVAAQDEFDAVDRSGFPSWGHQWYDEIEQELTKPQTRAGGSGGE